MSYILNSFKLVNAKRPNALDPIQFRRQKLSEKIGHQIALAIALKNGETYTVKRQRNVRDEASGLSTTVEVSKKVSNEITRYVVNENCQREDSKWSQTSIFEPGGLMLLTEKRKQDETILRLKYCR